MTTLSFADPVFESQAAFRAILAAMARPGAILACGEGLAPPAPLSPAAAAAILALADFETPLWIAPSLLAGGIASYLKFHTGAPLAASPDKAAFALIDAAADALRLADFAQGTQEYPDRSTTIVVQLSSLSNGPLLRLAGPGIPRGNDARRTISAGKLFRAMAEEPGGLSTGRRLYPRGRRRGRSAAPVGPLAGRRLMYVAVKGGERAIRNAHALLADRRRGDRATPDLMPAQIDGQLALAVDRVMSEGSLYDRRIAALAIKQARGDLIEAIFLVRAYRTTLPRFGFAETLDTGRMTLRRRVSATFKDLPGGQVLGPTFDYTHRLIDFDLETENAPEAASTAPTGAQAHAARVVDIIARDDLIEREAPPAPDALITDITRDAPSFPGPRDARLQSLARGDEGFLLSLAYSTQRGYGRTHPFVGEIRFGEAEVELFIEDLGFSVPLGEISLTECQMVNQFTGRDGSPPRFTRGYGLAFGQSERKAMAMALVDRALRADEFGEERKGPAQDEEFVLSHCDNVQATGFVEHLKLPHYVDFQAELALLRRLRRESDAKPEATK